MKFRVLYILLLISGQGLGQHTTAEVDSLNELSWSFMYTDFSKVLYYADQADSLSGKLNYDTGRGFAAIYKGWVSFYNSDYSKAYQLYQSAYDIGKAESNDRLLGRYYNSIGSYYTRIGDHELALESFQNANVLLKKVGDVEWESYGYNNIGANYINLSDYENARLYYAKALNLFKIREDSIGIALSYSNISSCFDNEKQIDSAIYYASLALESARSINFKMIIGSSQINLVEFYRQKQDYIKARQQLESVKSFYKNIDDIDGLIDVAFLEARLTKINDVNKAIILLEEFKPIINKINLPSNQSQLNQTLAALYFEKQDYKTAYQHLDEYVKWQDTLNNQASRENINELEIKYQTNEKILEIDNLNNKNELIQVKLDHQKLKEIQQRKTKYWIIAVGSTIAIFLSILLILIYRNNKKTKLANAIISAQKEDVENQKKVIEEKNTEIFDSITYAQRIQSAILPESAVISSCFTSHFLIYMPKDIVAGDFYWFEKKDGIRYFAVADCTGHGVPGAMVSVVCHNALNAAIYEHNLKDPGKILSQVRTSISETFFSNTFQINDGMDISLGVIDNVSSKFLWSGANNPLWQVKPNASEITIYHPDKQPVGRFEKAQPFTTHEINYTVGDIFYMFSDGFADQFGGPKNKKYKTANLKRLLLNQLNLDFDKQKANIVDEFTNWKGDQEQLDDICIFGFRL